MIQNMNNIRTYDYKQGKVFHDDPSRTHPLLGEGSADFASPLGGTLAPAGFIPFARDWPEILQEMSRPRDYVQLPGEDCEHGCCALTGARDPQKEGVLGAPPMFFGSPMAFCLFLACVSHGTRRWMCRRQEKRTMASSRNA